MKNIVVHYRKPLLVLLVILLALFGVAGLVGFSEIGTPEKLSELSTEELFQFLSDRGITFPEDAIPRDINAIVALIEKTPDFDPALSYTVAYEQIIAIRDVVNEYYGINIEK